MQEVRQERTGWRDEAISQRHRKWGWDCPAVDIDFLLLEYDNSKAVAIIEYKHERARPQLASRPSYQALINLGNRAGIPVIAVRYTDDFSTWKAVPLNTKAKEWLPERQEMTEREWVTLLYNIRGDNPPEALFEGASINI